MPSTAVYLVLPAWIALIAASLMFCGVSKSGSPAASPITSRPSAFSVIALLEMAMVADGWMRLSELEMKPMAVTFRNSGLNRVSAGKGKPQSAASTRRAEWAK